MLARSLSLQDCFDFFSAHRAVNAGRFAGIIDSKKSPEASATDLGTRAIRTWSAATISRRSRLAERRSDSMTAGSRPLEHLSTPGSRIARGVHFDRFAVAVFIAGACDTQSEDLSSRPCQARPPTYWVSRALEPQFFEVLMRFRPRAARRKTIDAHRLHSYETNTIRRPERRHMHAIAYLTFDSTIPSLDSMRIWA